MDALPELARSLGLIVAGLAEVVARRFLRDPAFIGLIVPLWHWLHRSARRFERIVLPHDAPRRHRTAYAGTARRTSVRLPRRKAWLVQALGYEAAGYGLQLEHLLSTPEMQAVLASVPAAGRILHPLCRMLGVAPPAKVERAVPAAQASRAAPLSLPAAVPHTSAALQLSQENLAVIVVAAPKTR